MKIKGTAIFVAVCGVGVSFADFQYSQTTKITGGALVSMTKTLGVFSKNARQMTDPQTSTIKLKNNMLRTEHPDGRIEIIDSEEKIDAFLPVLDRMMSSGLVTLEKVQVLQYGTPRAEEA